MAETILSSRQVPAGGSGSSYQTLITLGADVANSTITYADITGLSWAATSGVLYRFHALLIYTSAATTTGVKFGINGPASPTRVGLRATISQGGTSAMNNHMSTYDSGTISTTSTPGDNIATIDGIIQVSAAGTVILRFASEIAASAITIKAGSTLEIW